MLLTADYVRLMARYNGWQNTQIMAALDGVSLKRLTADMGAFFGSILGTLNHILWVDLLWLYRFGVEREPPAGSLGQSPAFTPTGPAWSAERFAADGRISSCARGLHNIDLQGDLSFHSGYLGAEVSWPMGICAMQMFNHQTHHRGQVHAMLTRAGLPAPITDIPFMPEEAQ